MMNEACYELHQCLNYLPYHRFPFDDRQIPLNGIYALFEDGEKAHGTNRIVRVGTHTGKDQLCSRLKQHFIQENKDRSIFRKNIGRALLNKDKDPFLEQWEFDLTTRAAKNMYGLQIDPKKQRDVELQVSEYIQSHFWFVVFAVPQRDDRLRLESRLISTVSLCKSCCPSQNWLGLFSPKEKIRESGLWIVNELYKQPLTQSELNDIHALVFSAA